MLLYKGTVEYLRHNFTIHWLKLR